MELLGIALSVPVALVLNALYCLVLSRVVLKFERPIRGVRAASYTMLAWFAVELVLLITVGSIRSSGLLGRDFYVMHLIVFFLGPRVLANLLVLRNRRGLLARWHINAAVCTVFASCWF